VLVTRAAHQASSLETALRERGAIPISAPVVDIGPPRDVHAIHRAIDDLSTYAWLVFTSSNGVDAFFDRLHSLDADARYMAGVRVAAIGEKTAHRLAHFGIRPDIIPALYAGEEIARALIEAAHTGDRVLIFRAQEARDVLPRMLEEAGLHADVVAAYQTTIVDDPHFESKASQADVLTFTSGSTVRGFVALLGGEGRAVELSREKIVGCIGPITADVAREAGLRVDVVAADATVERLVDALDEFFSTKAT
jgi:uroporphyrinogen III methyltransferase/synthase